MSFSFLQHYRYLFLFLLLLAGIVGIEYFITHNANFSSENLLPLAVTIDLVLGIPLLYYFLIVRHYSKVDTPTVLLIFLLSVSLAFLILPEAHHTYLHYAEKLLIFTELGLLTWGIVKIRKIVHLYNALDEKRADFLYNLKEVLTSVYGNKARLAVTEIATFRYGLFFWLGKTEKKEGEQAFSLHQDSGFVAAMVALLMVSVIEIAGLHFLLLRWNAAVAWIIFILSAYSIVFIIALLSSVIKRPILLTNYKLFVRIGLLWNADVELKNISGIRKISEADKFSKEALNLAKPLLCSPNLLITFEEPVLFEGHYGMKKSRKEAAIYVDQSSLLIENIKQMKEDKNISE